MKTYESIDQAIARIGQSLLDPDAQEDLESDRRSSGAQPA